MNIVKKLLLLLVAVLTVSSVSYADVIPSSVWDIPSGTFGVFQPTNSIKVYKTADIKSKVLYQKSWDYKTVSTEGFSDTMFAILQDKKELAFLYATDEDENFVEVIYDKAMKTRGWVNKVDDFQFLPWVNFYNMYGRKYGLKFLSGAPQYVFDIHTKCDRDSQVVGVLKRPRIIRLTAIQGNWALITAVDIDSVAKTGYVQWRGDDGELYLFPNMQ